MIELYLLLIIRYRNISTDYPEVDLCQDIYVEDLTLFRQQQLKTPFIVNYIMLSLSLSLSHSFSLSFGVNSINIYMYNYKCLSLAIISFCIISQQRSGREEVIASDKLLLIVIINSGNRIVWSYKTNRIPPEGKRREMGVRS